MDNDSASASKRKPVEISDEFCTYDDFFNSLSDSELDLLISLKELAISRAKNKGCEGCEKMIGLDTLRGLGVILLEYMKERMCDKSLLQAPFKGINPLDSLTLMKSEKARDLESTRILDARRSELATPIRKKASRQRTCSIIVAVDDYRRYGIYQTVPRTRAL